MYTYPRSNGGIPLATIVTGARPGYWWPTFQTTQVLPVQTIVKPEVIVIRPGPAGHDSAKAATDYGYVPGCRAIANGYHCDIAENAR